jgi:hypothetical protein
MPPPDYVTDWGDAIRLVSYQLPAAAISPGDSFRAIFYFVNLAPLDDNLNVLVRLVGPGNGPNGEDLSRSEGWPWGAATSDWRQGEVWPDGRELAIPADAIPWCTVVDYIPYPQDFRYRFWGTARTRIQGYDVTGKSTLDLRPFSVAVTVIITKGSVRIVCAIIRPGTVSTR